MKNSIKEWFSFSKKERVGIIVLIVIMATFFLLPTIFEPKLSPILVDTTTTFNSVNSATEKFISAGVSNDSVSVVIKPILFYFDPNSITEKGWLQLGLKPKIINTINNYRNKGGQFRVAADLKKIWGLSPEEADRLIPYVQMKQIEVKQKYVAFKTGPPKNVFDINNASAADWESLPGIGPVLANRIMRYRDKLGGFNSVEQIKKTYGITDSVYQIILPSLSIKEALNEPLKKVDIELADINKADEATMIKVGIPASIAKAIVLYRRQYGNYQQMKDLKKIVFINEAVFQQIIPKLRIE